ncbi:fimbrial protein [Rahnella contaminans]|uniref:fimbrial protein n=1 Tax=Rahnella contaminans TaxID=2703882 RepID=UPI003C2B43E9
MYKFLFILIFAAFMPNVFACQLSGDIPSSPVINIGSIHVRDDLKVGDTISENTYPLNASGRWHSECTTSSEHTVLLVSANREPEGEHVYRTNISGIGFKISVISLSHYMHVQNDYIPSVVKISTPATINGSDLKIRIKFVRTAGVLGTGDLNINIPAFMRLLDDERHTPTLISSLTIQGQTSPGTCGWSSATTHVDMGTISKTDFHKTNGISTTAGKLFYLELDCSTKAAIKLHLTGNTASGKSDVLSLKTGPNAASGVGIQLLYLKNILTLGSSFRLEPSHDETGQGVRIPLLARLVKTEPVIQSGDIEGVAIFSVEYD